MNHVHLSSATTQVVNRMKSFDDIKPKKKGKGTDKVVRSLCEWADRILCRNNEYVDDIVTQSIKEGETSIRKNNAMKKRIILSGLFRGRLNKKMKSKSSPRKHRNESLKNNC